jgi:hypothetical protein
MKRSMKKEEKQRRRNETIYSCCEAKVVRTAQVKGRVGGDNT